MNSNLRRRFDELDQHVVHWLARCSLPFLRLGMGTVFLWFGVLKLFPGLSPASDLAARTIHALTFGLIPRDASLKLLATVETVIGLGFLSGSYMRVAVVLLALQMIGTLAPLVLFPAEEFTLFPYAPTLEGQYIIKNVILIGAGLVIGSTVRGAQIVAEPEHGPSSERSEAATQPPGPQAASESIQDDRSERILEQR
jgi:uncharacterized membrane protein YphA (DoxX/SURF4 family)